MNQMEKAKKSYDSIPVPAELYDRVQMAIAQADTGKTGAREIHQDSSPERQKPVRRKRWPAAVSAAAAAVMAVFITALNTSTVFAQEMEKIPVLGAIAHVFTFNSYVEEKEDMTIAVNIPSLEMISQDTEGLADSVNETIHTFCEQYAQEAVKRAEEYKEAFMATGGTQEEWEAHNIQINVGYEIKSQTPEYLSFIVTGTENWASAYAQTLYYTIDLGSGKLVSLQEVLGPDYRSIADESIRAQMKARTDVEFFTPEEGGFTGIDENTRFYMNADGNPVIVFEKYEIAPGSAGQPEFVIDR